MTPLQATEAICKAAVDGVALLSGPPLVVLEGERGKPTTSGSWVRLTMRDLEPERGMTHGPSGNRLAQRRGFLIAQCFAPHTTDDGVAGAITLAQGVRSLFEGRDLEGAGATSPTTIYFADAVIRRVGVDGAFYQVNVEATFHFHEAV